MSPFRFRNHGFAIPKVRISHPVNTARLQTDARPSRDGSERFGPARKHTAKFEPAAWSWAQMTSGSGSPPKTRFE
jgi:hypothetical protein